VDEVRSAYGHGVASLVRNERDEVAKQTVVLRDEQRLQRLGAG
jgi:hypothetical protein